MKLQLSDHFTYGRLLRFTAPSILMTIFASVYSVADGFFVSNYSGRTALAAVNLSFPFIAVLAAAGFMIGAGGSALVAKLLGEGNRREALRTFSLFIYFASGLGCVLAVVGRFTFPGLLRLMGAEGELFDRACVYARILLISLPFFTLQQACESFFVAAGRPQIGLVVTVASGLTNIFLDYLLVVVLRGGLTGAAWATSASAMLGGTVSIIWFARPNSGSLRLGRGPWNGKAVVRGCVNGLSELVSEISGSLVGMLFNAQLMRLLGEEGVAAYSVLMYVSFVFVAVFVGYSVGCGPVVAFSYGAGNRAELRNLLKKSLTIISIAGASMTLIAAATGGAISEAFVGYDARALDLTRRAFDVYSLSFLFAGFGIFGSAFFTGLNNGPVSAVIAVSRALVFEAGCVLMLPALLGGEGIWLSAVVAEGLSCVVTFALLARYGKRYGY